MEYSKFQGLVKGVKYGVIFLIAALIDQIIGQNLWGVNSITLGGVLVIVVNVLKVRYGLRLP